MTAPLPLPVIGMWAAGAVFSITSVAASARLAWRNYHPEGPTMLAKIAALLSAMFTPKVRLSLYIICAAVLTLLVYYRIVDAGSVPLWLGLAAAILGLGHTTAAVTLAAQLRAGSR